MSAITYPYLLGNGYFLLPDRSSVHIRENGTFFVKRSLDGWGHCFPVFDCVDKLKRNLCKTMT